MAQKPNCPKGCGMKMVPSCNGNGANNDGGKKAKCSKCDVVTAYPREIFGCWRCFYYLCDECYPARQQELEDQYAKQQLEEQKEKTEAASKVAAEARAKASAAKEREEKAKRETAEVLQRTKAAEAEIEMKKKKLNAKLKKEEHEREEQAKEAARAYEKEKQEALKKDRDEKVKFFETKLNAAKTEKTNIDTKRKEAEKQTKALTMKEAEQEQKLKDFPALLKIKKEELNFKCGLEDAKKTMQKGEDEIRSAIEKTGQQYANVGKFLALAAKMSSATMDTTAKSNTLEAQISTFGTLITRECRTNLSITAYSEKHAECLLALLPGFEAEGFDSMASMKCASDEEFDEILAIAEKIAKANQLKQQQAAIEQKEAERVKKEFKAMQMKAIEQKTTEQNSTDENQSENKEPDGDQKEKPTETESKQLTVNRRPQDDSSDEEEEKEEPEEKSAEDLMKEYGLHKKYWAKFVEEGWDEAEYWKEMTDADLKELGVRGGFKAKFKAMVAKEAPVEEEPESALTVLQKRKLHDICRKWDSWQDLETEMEVAAKKALGGISKCLSPFFSNIHGGIMQSQTLIGGFRSELSGPQMKAIKASMPSADAVQYDEAELSERDAWKKGSQCEVYSKSSLCWLPAEIKSIDEEKAQESGEKLEWLVLENVKGGTVRLGRGSQFVRPSEARDADLTVSDLCIQGQTATLIGASLVAIKVTDMMAKIFDEDTTTLRAKTVATGVEDCCVGIIQSQATIRQALLMVEQIRALKPAHLEGTAAALWECMDEGAKSIMSNALEMTKVAAQYFGFFLKFKSSFQYYQSNAEASLTISTQYLAEDCKKFAAFNRDFTRTVQMLNSDAMRVITACVERGIGIENFQTAQKDREKNKEAYLSVKAKYDQQLADWKLKHGSDALTAVKIQYASERAEQEAAIKLLKADDIRCAALITDLNLQIKTIKSEKLPEQN